MELPKNAFDGGHAALQIGVVRPMCAARSNERRWYSRCKVEASLYRK